jgi:PAS domain S-box-containing protein
MSERTPADQALIDAVISDLPGGVLMIDPQGRIVDANPAAARILGRRVEDLAGQALPAIRKELAVMLQTASKAEVELPDPAGGSSRTLGFTSRRVASAGVELGMVISFADITADLARQRRRAHQHRLADLGKVVASVAHEIRNPIFAISSLSQLLADEDAIVADDDLALMIGKIRAEASRVARLLEDLLAFGRDRPLSPRPVDIVAELQELVTDLGEVVPRAEGDVGVAVSLRVGPALAAAPVIQIDPDALRRVVVNLVRNGRRAVAQRIEAEQGEGSTGAVVVTVDADDGLLVTVSDDGIGIPPEHLPEIFEAFFSRDPKGTGLGLAVVRRLVDQLGGHLDLQSHVGHGTKVTLRVP